MPVIVRGAKKQSEIDALKLSLEASEDKRLTLEMKASDRTTFGAIVGFVKLTLLGAAGFVGYGADQTHNDGKITTVLKDGVARGTESLSQICHAPVETVNSVGDFLKNHWDKGAAIQREQTTPAASVIEANKGVSK